MRGLRNSRRQWKPIRGMQKAFGTLTSPSLGRCNNTSWCNELHFRGARFQFRECTTAEARLKRYGKSYTKACRCNGTLLFTMAPYGVLSEVPSAEQGPQDVLCADSREGVVHHVATYCPLPRHHRLQVIRQPDRDVLVVVGHMLWQVHRLRCRLCLRRLHCARTGRRGLRRCCFRGRRRSFRQFGCTVKDNLTLVLHHRLTLPDLLHLLRHIRQRLLHAIIDDSSLTRRSSEFVAASRTHVSPSIRSLNWWFLTK